MPPGIANYRTGNGLDLELSQAGRHDVKGMREVCDRAFKRSDEGNLVDKLYKDAHVAFSLSAEMDSVIVGLAIFSKLKVQSNIEQPIQGVALGPVAVWPENQNLGIGSALIRHGIETCRHSCHDYDFAVVLGNPLYYSRFGFSSKLAKKIRSPYSGAGDDFMALELKPHSLDAVSLDIFYPPSFALVS